VLFVKTITTDKYYGIFQFKYEMILRE